MVNPMTIPYHFTTLFPAVSIISYLYQNTYSVLYTSFKDAPEPPPSPVQLLQEELRKKNMLFPKNYLQLNRVIGQGEKCEENYVVCHILILLHPFYQQESQAWCTVDISMMV